MRERVESTRWYVPPTEMNTFCVVKINKRLRRAVKNRVKPIIGFRTSPKDVSQLKSRVNLPVAENAFDLCRSTM